MTEQEQERLRAEIAKVSELPSHSGDGYCFGGGVILTIGERSFFIGENYNRRDFALAQEIARRWNSALKGGDDDRA
jgi:hypothetical protein